MNDPSCVVIGEGSLPIQCAAILLAKGIEIRGLVSNDPVVQSWAAEKGISCNSSGGEMATFLSKISFDYLFSIGNYRVIPLDVLRLPHKAAINFHDGPLPKYAGTYATSWAIINRAESYAITWHLMTDRLDAGDTLLAHPLTIEPNETTASLNAKCYEAAITSFELLADQIVLNGFRAIPQDESQRTYYPYYKRPASSCILSGEDSAEEIDSLVRALDFGRYPNAFGVPRVKIGSDFFVVSETRLLHCPSTSPPGTILRIDREGLEIATTTSDIVLSGLMSVDGETVDADDLARRYGLHRGYRLVASEPGTVALVGKVYEETCRNESFWVRRLASVNPYQFPLPSPAVSGTMSARFATLPVEIQIEPDFLRSERDKPAFMLAAFAAFLARIGEDATFHVGVADREQIKELCGLESLFESCVPLAVEAKESPKFSDFVEALAKELEDIKKRKTFLRDVKIRYPELRGKTELQGTPALPVNVLLGPDLSFDAAPACRELTLTIPRVGSSCLWTYNTARFDSECISGLAQQFATFLQALISDPNRGIDEYPLLSDEEKNRLLLQCNDTAAAYSDDKCLHELFETRAELAPGDTAVVFRDKQLSYGELNARANQLANHLKGLGVGPDKLVGICIDRSIEMMVGLLGILKAGGAYVPLDPAYPHDRLEFMIQDSKLSVLLTARRVSVALPAGAVPVVYLDSDWEAISKKEMRTPISGVRPHNLAYVIYTSGSTGRPKGVMVEHRNVTNFFAGMDRCIGVERGVWMAVTSISFDISVLELFWTLARGFKIVIYNGTETLSQPAHSTERTSTVALSKPGIDFSLFYFASHEGRDEESKYRLLLEGAKFADENGFAAVWTPERHFHAFGGLYPNPSLTAAAVAAVTNRIQIRAGSVVLPLHNPVRVAEEWSVVDNLSNGRAGVSFASGWHASDFVLAPDNYDNRKEVMVNEIETVRRLWRGDSINLAGVNGQEVKTKTFPRPVRKELPIWMTATGNPESFAVAGRVGAGLLTNLLGQSVEELGRKVRIYRDSWNQHGHGPGGGHVVVMLHTFLGEDLDEVRETVRKPFSDYLRTSVDLIKDSPWAYPGFSRQSREIAKSLNQGLAAGEVAEADMEAVVAHAFERYFETSGLFGTPETCLNMVRRMKEIGVDEIACLIDFGVEFESVMKSLQLLKLLQETVKNRESIETRYSIGSEMLKHKVTHLQCTPSFAEMLAREPDGLSSLSGLRKLMIGGEPLSPSLVERLREHLFGDILNMYGPTETTVWSLTYSIDGPSATIVPIGRPIANTQAYLLDRNMQPIPAGVPGELYLGGDGVTRGYLNRAELTEERFVRNPFSNHGSRLYKTGDLGRYKTDGNIEFLGRIDNQVKIRGHRVELGELESALTSHDSVREAVAVIQGNSPVDQQLVAYVTLDRPAQPIDKIDGLAQWEAVWNETYLQEPYSAAPSFNISGWKSSYTGAQIPEEEMRDWVENTVSRILSFKPRRVLEIGCGAGLLLHRVAPHCESYYGTDISENALRLVKRELERTQPGSLNVTLLKRSADDFTGFENASFDTVILNSIVQYFPGVEYLRRVVEGAVKLVRPGGVVFIGDVRNLELMEAFHSSVEFFKAAPSLTVAELKHRIRTRISDERELLIDPLFFHLSGA